MYDKTMDTDDHFCYINALPGAYKSQDIFWTNPNLTMSPAAGGEEGINAVK